MVRDLIAAGIDHDAGVFENGERGVEVIGTAVADGDIAAGDRAGEEQRGGFDAVGNDVVNLRARAA